MGDVLGILRPGAGDDRVDGGAGFDTVDYGAATTAITVDLSRGTATGQGIGEDRLGGIEAVMGGTGNDKLTGSSAANCLEGAAGDDVLAGGAGADRFVFRPGSGDDRIMDFSLDGDDEIHLIGYGFSSLDDVLSAATTVGSTTAILLDDDASLTLVGVKLAQLHEDDFRFA